MNPLAAMVHVLELFSGIGGMRHGLVAALNEEVSFTAIDLNVFCNTVYENSFGDKPITADVTALSVEWFEELKADIWTLAPPCQPYSRQGGMLGSADARARPLHHLIDILRQLEHLPKRILLENVKNFELSDSCAELVAVLRNRGYGSIAGYLVNPLYMGFPNSRLRFFLVAKREEGGMEFPIISNDPQCGDCGESPVWLQPVPARPIAGFLCPSHSETDKLALEVPESILSKKSAFCFDIVAPKSTQSLCFTRAYTKFVNGTGSVLYEGGQETSVDAQNRPLFDSLESMSDLAGELRYFCPCEIARLNGFPVSGDPRLATGCSGSKQIYRALGNSLNPQVVARIVSNTFS
jgi:tRNA (cytosine38-C5)-methyltransferase